MQKKCSRSLIWIFSLLIMCLIYMLSLIELGDTHDLSSTDHTSTSKSDKVVSKLTTKATKKNKETEKSKGTTAASKLNIPQKMTPYSLHRDMEDLAKKYKKNNINMTLEVIGRTASYNNILLLKISSLNAAFRTHDTEKYMVEPELKKIIFIVHGLNIAGMTKLRCLSELKYFEKLLGYYMEHLDLFEIFLIPMANPDGYQYSKVHTNWFKNLSPQKFCAGVNVDRNFEIGWRKTDISPCSQFYPGTSAACEQEVKAVRRILLKYANRIYAFIHVHASSASYTAMKGDAILYPPAYTEMPKDDDKYLDIKEELNEMMINTSFEQLTLQVEPLFYWYGMPVTGTSIDYAAMIYGIPFAMEFAMQLYSNAQYNDWEPDYDIIALEQIWRRVIHVVFNNFHRNREKDIKTNDLTNIGIR